MSNSKTVELEKQVKEELRCELDRILHKGAHEMLIKAIQDEVADYLSDHIDERDPETGRRLVTRNGYHNERNLQTVIGDMRIRQPRIHDKRKGQKFTSSILPPYLRRSPSIETLLPVLYLKGISSNSFQDALEPILGPAAAGLSASTIVRLKSAWEDDYKEWSKRDLSGKRYVYWWVDGIYFNVRLTDDRPCFLVIMGTLEDGTKELVGVWDGERESELSWSGFLGDLKRRGLKESPKLCIGDGAMGFWKAKEQQFPKARIQRCWVHKTANILDKMAKKVQPSAKPLIHEMYLSPTKKDALEAYDEFLRLYKAKYPKACHCLEKDKDVLFTFYDFPAEHWIHIRSTNAIESTFSTVRHRTRQTKGCGSRVATLAMGFKLAREAEKRWRRINGYEMIEKVISGVEFKDGIEQIKEAA